MIETVRSLIKQRRDSVEQFAKGGMTGDFVETLLAREKDLRLATRAQVMAQRLLGKRGAPGGKQGPSRGKRSGPSGE